MGAVGHPPSSSQDYTGENKVIVRVQVKRVQTCVRVCVCVKEQPGGGKEGGGANLHTAE